MVELREHARDLTNNLLTGFPGAGLAAMLERVITADALIAVTPIFSASYSGLFKVFMDVIQPESLAGKPVLIAATAGTARHSLALEHAMRPLFAYLRAVVVPTAVFAATEDWASEGALTERIERAASELAALIRSVRGGAKKFHRSGRSDPVRRSAQWSDHLVGFLAPPLTPLMFGVAAGAERGGPIGGFSRRSAPGSSGVRAYRVLARDRRNASARARAGRGRAAAAGRSRTRCRTPTRPWRAGTRPGPARSGCRS